MTVLCSSERFTIGIFLLVLMMEMAVFLSIERSGVDLVPDRSVVSLGGNTSVGGESSSFILHLLLLQYANSITDANLN